MMAPSIKRAISLRLLVLGLGVWLGCLPALAQTSNARAEVDANTELNVLLQAPKMAPLKWFASTDKTGGNDDFVLLKPGETRRVPLAAGDLERLWSTGLDVDNLDLSLENGPGRIVPLLHGGHALLGELLGRAFTLFPTITFDAVREMRPGATLIAVNHSKAPNKWFYQVGVRPPATRPLPVLPDATKVDKVEVKLDLPPGAEKDISTWNAPGLIYELQVALDDGSAKGVFEKVRLHADWDGQNGQSGTRSVDAPLMSLGGQVAGSEMVRNAVCDYDGARILLRWPMPFRAAHLALQNQTDRELKLDAIVRVQSYDSAPSDYRFCALERTAPTKHGQPMDILHTTGEGAFAGLALAIAPNPNSSRRTFAFLEGDETITADGQKFQGTGTEDYFSSAWYWAFTGGPFQHPYEGLTLLGQAPPQIAAYRWQINDAIPFSHALDFKFEHGNGNNSNDGDFQWKWVAFWYQKLPLPAGLAEAGASSSSGGSAANAPGSAPAAPRNRLIWLGLGAVIVLIGVGGLALRAKRRA